MESKELATVIDNKRDLVSPEHLDNIIEFGKKIISSGITPLKTAEEVLVAVLYGRELGLGAMVSVNNISPINGRAGVGIHIIAAKILQAGVKFTVIKDFEPIYKYYIKNQEGGLVEIGDEVVNLPDHYQIITKTTPKEAYNGKTRVLKTIEDRVTSIAFERKIKYADGTWFSQIHTQEFKWSDAIALGLAGKDNWNKQPANMMRTRCLSMGSRFIADDAILGIFEIDELREIENVTEPENVQVFD